MTLDYLIEKYIEKTGYGMDMWSKEENATMITVAEIIAESEVNKLNKPAVISSLDLNELKRKLDDALESETTESLNEWLNEKRQ